MYGSESKIDRLYEGGNVKLIGIPQSKSVEVWDQNLYGSESNIDCPYEWGNVRSIGIPQSRIVEVRDQNYLNLIGITRGETVDD